MPRTILLSYTTTLDCVVDGSLQEKDLEDAIFCFGCGSMWPHANPSTIMREQQGFQKNTLTPDIVELVHRHLEAAEEAGRAVWRWCSPQELHQRLSQALEACGLKPLNPNLPPAPVTDNGFLKTAIERVNNKDGVVLVRVVGG